MTSTTTALQQRFRVALFRISLVSLSTASLLFFTSPLQAQNINAQSNSTQYTITIGGPKPTEIRQLSGEEQSKFEAGEIVFDCFWRCAMSFNRPQLDSLYKEKKWGDLASKVIEIKFETDLSYYYLGYSAEMLGHYKAAVVYYQRALSTKEKCRSGSMNLCNGIDLPGVLNSRIREAGEKLYAKERGISTDEARTRMIEDQAKLRRENSKSVSANGKISVGERNPEGKTIKLRCTIHDGLTSSWDVLIDLFNGTIKLNWVGGSDQIAKANSEQFENKVLDLVIDDEHFPPSYQGQNHYGGGKGSAYVISRGPRYSIAFGDTLTGFRTIRGGCNEH